MKIQNLLTLAALAAASLSAHAGTFTTITPDGDINDWTGIAPSYEGPSGNSFSINSISVANDENYIYLLVQFENPVNPQTGNGLVVSFDTDNNLGTGFDIFGMGKIGADASWQNDFPFRQSAGVYNNGDINNGGAAISSYATETNFQEYGLSLSATFADDNSLVFPALGTTIRIMFWTDNDPAMTTDAFTYTLATVPEPAGFGLFAAMGAMGLLFVRRRR